LEFGGKKPYSEHYYLRKITFNEFNTTYDLLRYVESLLILFPEISCGNNKDLLIKKLITNPNNYCSTSNLGKSTLNNYLIDFMAEANKSKHADLVKLSPFLFQKRRQLHQAVV
jgi:hypothetical protein